MLYSVFNIVDTVLAEQPARREFAADYILLELGEDDHIDELAAVLERMGARAERAFPRLTLEEDADLAQVYIVYSDGDLQELITVLSQDRENVDLATKDLLISHLPPVSVNDATLSVTEVFIADDPLIAQQWWLQAIGANEVHRVIRDLTPARKAVVGVLDSGVDGRHEDIRSVFGSSSGDTDENGHGTHCAGIAGAAANNGIGIGSLNWEGRFIEIRGYAVLAGEGVGTAEKLAQGILDATRDGVDVISLSLGAWSPLPPKVLSDAVEFALDRGVVVVAAAGNSSADATEHTPSNIEGVISVAAVDDRMRKASFSNTNGRLSQPLSAPGVGILSLMPSDSYKSLNGTSMATPVVSSLAGLLRAIDPELTSEQLFRLLSDTATPGRPGDDIGRVVNAENAVLSLLGEGV